MEDNKQFLGTEPIGKLLIKLSIPTVLAQLINMLYNVVDRIYIGHMEGDGSLALTGVGVCMPLIMIVSAFAALVSSGGAPRASIFMGKQEDDYAEKILGNCFTLQIIVSIIITAILLLFNRNLLLAFGASNNTIEYATDYMNVYAIGTIFVQMTLGMNFFISAQGFTKISMISVIIGAVLNIVLDPIFIYGFNMGVKGAALATIISQASSCVWIVSFLCSKHSRLRIKIANMRIQAKIILPCVALGTAAFIMQASESVISICFNSSLLKYGGDIAVGAMTILTSVMQFAMLPMQGVAQGAQPISSYNYGARKTERVKATFKLLLITCLTYSFTLWALVMLFPQIFVSIFTPNKALIEFAAPMLRIYLGGLCIFGIQIACQMTFTSLGKALSSITVAVVRKFVLLLPLIYVMPLLIADKTLAVYMAEPVADVIAVSFTTILFIFQFKKAIKEIEDNNDKIDVKATC
ncbi:MAG: MATE family efflux transporter [Clostridia bacterium]|nr:MATE family efflux transporter [Clostridia bacterium]